MGRMDWKKRLSDKIQHPKEAAEMINKWQLSGEKVVFTNGCFDILHKGHIDYLAAAASLGQRLVIGLNTDESVNKLKGEGRPVNNNDARALMLAALHFTSIVTFFSEDTPYNLIKTVQPDILVKGSDYIAADIVGFDIVTQRGGEVLTVELTDGYSTTKLIERIKESY